MKNVELTSREFLSFYTGRMFANSFVNIVEVAEKLVDERPMTSWGAKFVHERFREHINNKKPELKRQVELALDTTKYWYGEKSSNNIDIIARYFEIYPKYKVKIDIDEFKSFCQEFTF